ncbi:hypothetical protein [Jatrophihabitans fulvus]
MISALRHRVTHRATHRRPSCRRTGHDWTLMSDPPACARCGRCAANA